MKISNSLCGLALALSTAASVSAQTPAAWTQPVNVAATEGALTKTAGCDGCPDAGARAAVSISGDGYVEYTPVTGYLVKAGLSADAAAPQSADYDFAFTTWPGGGFEIRERGAYKSDGTYTAGDRLKISVESGTVVFRKNNVVVYTSQATPAPTLTFGVTLYTAGASMRDAVIGVGGAASGASSTNAVKPPPAPFLATWTQPVNVTATAGALAKTAGCDGCPDAGARAAVSIAGDGYVEYTPVTGYLVSAGLSADPAAPLSTAYDFAFNTWPGGAFEIRERGAYKTDGAYAAGDRVRIGVESGKVVFRKNGVVVYTSQAAPAPSLTFGVSLFTAGASMHDAVIGLGGGGSTQPSQPPQPTQPPQTTQPPSAVLPGGLVSVGSYRAIVDRLPHAKPATPALGPAGSTIVDPTFSSKITRITDGLTRPGTPNRSYRSPSSPHQNAWSANGSYFYVVSTDGSVMPFRFDAGTGKASRLQASASGDGGLMLRFYNEPQFSYVNDSLIYGSVAGGTLRTVDQYDFSTGLYTRLFDLDALLPGLAGTGVGGIASTGGPIERIETFFGGVAQDKHHYVLIFDKANPQNRLLLDTTGNTLNGVPTSRALSFSLHHVAIDRSGRYVMLYTSWADQQSARKAAQSYLWDTTTGTFTEIGVSALPYGHDAFGYGVAINQDCCTSSAWDAAQWQVRGLAAPLVTRDLIVNVVRPVETYLSEHSTWNNARADRLEPVVTALFRSPMSTTEWRPWDDEIVAIQTDASAGGDPTVWRFAHHRTDTSSDLDRTAYAFWYTPRPNISHDGRWVLFTSNWDKTLGIDPKGDAGTQYRQDAFVVELASSTASAPPPPPVAVGVTALPGGRATVGYSAALSATGGQGTYAWTVSSGSLPAGLSLDGATGVVSGSPRAAGAYSFTVDVADAAAPANRASGAVTISIGASPVAVTTASLDGGRARTAYGAALQASGGTGAYTWTLASGTLPDGLALDPSGTISGTPVAAGTYTFRVAVADRSDAANIATADLTIVLAPPPVSVAMPALAGGRLTVPYTALMQAAGGTGAYRWTIAGGSLPAGLSLDAATGAITGTATAVGSSSFTITVADAAEPANAASASGSIAIGAAPVSIATASLPAGRSSVSYKATMTATGGSGIVTWSVAGGALPAGLGLNTTTGVIAGTPGTAGTYAVTLAATDAGDASNKTTATYQLEVAPAVKVASPRNIPEATVDTPYAYQMLAKNVVGTTTWNLQGGAPPPGITLSSTGLVSGTCAVKGTYYFNARVKDLNTDHTLTITLVVN